MSLTSAQLSIWVSPQTERACPEMVAARIFNEREGTPRETLHGAVTTGDVWKFLRLEGDTVWIDQPVTLCQPTTPP